MRNAFNEQEDFIQPVSHEEFIELENNCTLCGTPLEFEHTKIEGEKKIVEKCTCPSCGLEGQDRSHPVN